MASASYLTLDQLNKKRPYRRTVVRLTRKWEARNLTKNNELLGMNFLLLDEKENTIQGYVHYSLIEKFGDGLREGAIIEICNFNVQECNKNYRVSDHKFQIRLTERTSVACEVQQIPQMPLENFRFHEDLNHLKDSTYDLYDVIGYIKNMEKADVRSRSKPVIRRVILTLLLGRGIEIQATLWAEQAELFEDKHRAVESKNIVLIMTSFLVKTYEGAIYLSASSGTKFYLNNDFDSVSDFRTSFRFDGDCSVNLGDMVEIPSMTNEISEVQHSINDIWDFIASDIPQKKTFMCTATITNIVSHSGWNYISCSSCSTKLTKSESSLYCKQCAKSQSVGVLSFRIEVIVDDGKDSATFVIFDEDGLTITGATAEDIKKDSPEQGLKDIPKCVESIVGKTYLFEIRVKEKDFQTSYQSFAVSKIHKHIESTPVDSSVGNKRRKRGEENKKEESENLQKKPHV